MNRTVAIEYVAMCGLKGFFFNNMWFKSYFIAKIYYVKTFVTSFCGNYCTPFDRKILSNFSSTELFGTVSERKKLCWYEIP